jgi:hypothetical protein
MAFIKHLNDVLLQCIGDGFWSASHCKDSVEYTVYAMQLS